MSTIAVRPRALLASKLIPPTARGSQVPRTRVHERIRAARAARLVLVRAPAGFGKTTAMTQCMALLDAEGIATAWLTLDDGDNDVARFLSGLEAAVARLMREEDLPPVVDHTEHDRALGDLAFELVARLAGSNADFALFLDDVERIQNATVLGLLREIINHLPRGGQLVLGSRSLPDLGLGRLRARGQLLEIDAADLRFSREETADFLIAKRGLPLTEQDLTRIHDKTEGWVAALWLASLALENHGEAAGFINRFSGADAAIADYLAEDVLARQPPELREFLLRTSILRHLSAPLCAALLPGCDSEAMLQRLDAANIFITPIEGEQRSYRYHSLFADFLRARLAQEAPEEIPRLHRAASDWYQSQGQPVPAIDHALEAQDFDRALALLGEHAHRLLSQGRMRLLARWFDAVPPERLRVHPGLQVIYVWALSLTRGPHAAMEALQRTGLEQSDDPRIRPHVLALRPLLYLIMDRFEEAHASGRDSLKQLPTGEPFADMTLINAMANVYTVLGQHPRARELLDRARGTDGGSGPSFNTMYSESVEGIIDLQEGRQRQAAARFRLAVAATRRANTFNPTGGNAWAGILYASAVYESNDLPLAARLLHVYVPLAKDVGLPDHMILGDAMLARIAFHDGDVDRAFAILVGLEHIGHARHLPRVVASARLERARLLLLQGHTHTARTELDRADDRELWQRVSGLHLLANDLEDIALARLRWEVLAGDADAACTRIERAIAAATSAAHHRRALKLRLLLAMAEQRSGKTRPALATIGAVLRQACAEGYVRLLVDEGPLAGGLVRQFHNELRERGCDRRDPILADYLQRLLTAFGPMAAEPPPMPDPHDTLVEPLTPKEIRVLQLLAEGYSNSAIAEKLFVSDSTVRTHLRNINAKLKASSRTQAVAVARRIGLI